MKVIKEKSQIFLTEDMPLLKTIDYSKLKGNPYEDTESGKIRFYAGGSDKNGKYVRIQFRKVVGAYTHLNTVNLSIPLLNEILLYMGGQEQ